MTILSRSRPVFVWALFFSLGCFPPKPWQAIRPKPPAASQPAAGTAAPANQKEPSLPEVPELILADGTPPAEEASGALLAPAPATPLSDAEAEAILQSLPPLPTKTEEVSFSLREDSLPPPKTGDVVQGEFPPKEASATPRPEPEETTEPLEVLRYSPVGQTRLPENISITFSQPMIALSSLEETEKTRPVRLTPEPPGKWRWVGARTLVFEPEGMFPRATEYTVEIPAGTKSVLGGVLSETIRFSFTTPVVALSQTYPADSWSAQTGDTLLFLSFNQKIEPEKILPHITARSRGKVFPLRLATPEEIEADPHVRQLAKGATDGTYMVLRSDAKFPYGSRVRVTVGPGLPSAEGPLLSKKPEKFHFKTYGPLQIEFRGCGGLLNRCRLYESWMVTFTNPLDEAIFEKSMVKVSPELPGFSASVSGNILYIEGEKEYGASYQVTISPELTDIFGQMYSREKTLTFRIAPEKDRYDNELYSIQQGMAVLDPQGAKRLPVYSRGQKTFTVRMYKVEPKEYPDFLKYLYDSETFSLPGELVFSQEVAVEGELDQREETLLDLSPALKDGLGHVIVVVEPKKKPKNRYLSPLHIWVQVTKIGLDAFVDGEQLVAWASSLEDGSSLEGVDLWLSPQEGRQVRTDARGLASFSLEAKPGQILFASKDGDTAFLPYRTYRFLDEDGWKKAEGKDTLRWYVFDDRKLYRPGEEVKIKGWLRRAVYGPKGDLGGLAGMVNEVRYELNDSQGNRLLEGKASLSQTGGFELVLPLPETVNLGNTWLSLEALVSQSSLEGKQYTHSFQVEEFRRPEFEVTTGASEGPLFLNQDIALHVNASYYAGGPLPGASVVWRLDATRTSYTPPGHSDFTFGISLPWWERGGYNHVERSAAHSGQTGMDGAHHLKLSFGESSLNRPLSISAQATVYDVNRQAWTSSETLLVHPSSLYVGVKSERYFVNQGEAFPLDLIVTDIDGKAIPGVSVLITVSRQAWVQEEGLWKRVEADKYEQEVLSGQDPVRLDLSTGEGGTYHVVVSVTDGEGRKNQSQMSFWVAGEERPSAQNVTREEVRLIPDKKEYQPGDIAEILVLSPFPEGEGVLTLLRQGIVMQEHFTLKDSSQVLKVKIEENFLPKLQLQVDLVGAAPRVGEDGEALPKRPAFAQGTLSLPVSAHLRTLSLNVSPREMVLAPGSATTIDVTLTDASGAPVSGEVALVVVDDALLALSGYRLPDIIEAFYPEVASFLSLHQLRSYVFLLGESAMRYADNDADGILDADDGPLYQGAIGTPLEMEQARVVLTAAAKAASSPGRALGKLLGGRKKSAEAGAAPPPAPVGQAAPGKPLAVRTDFRALALFAGSVMTNEEGRAEIPFTLPDNLTRYRIMAVAVSGEKKFGAGENTLTARNPLMVRPSPPRFLHAGDKAEVPVVLQNQTEAPLQIKVAARALGVSFTAAKGYQVTVPANDRVEVRFPVEAKAPGAAFFQVAAVSDPLGDAGQFAFPIYTPATTEAFATYGQIDEGAVFQPIKAPNGVFTEVGGVEITTSSTALSSLTDAVVYLQTYPYECAEQIASRVLSTVALKDVLSAFEAEGLPAPEEMIAAVEKDIEKLASLQNRDGGFGFWKRGETSWPYLSIHVAHALARAKEKGFAVPQDTLDSAIYYLSGVESKIPLWYSKESRRSIIAYGLYVLDLLGQGRPGPARRMVQRAGKEKLSFEALGWLLPTLAKDPQSQEEVQAILKMLKSQVEETASTAHFASSYQDGEHVLLYSDRRTDGVLLDALIQADPKSDIIPKLVEGLLAHRKKGRWLNTQENVFILLALDRYFRTFEKVTPDFVARAWLGAKYAGEHAFKGRTTEKHHIGIPMDKLNPEKTEDIIIAKEGAGRLYYRLGLSYALKDRKLEPLDAGFLVERSYEAIDDPDDVKQDPDGTWRIKAGARVRVKLKMVAPGRRYHVALVDTMPAGFEALNPALATTERIPSAPDVGGDWWRGTWFEHQNLRDERAEAFTTFLWEGVYSYSYVARATTPGVFTAPPAKAEEMYAPETFGRSGVDRVIIE